MARYIMFLMPVFFAVLLAGCSQPTGDNPIVPGGEVPELLAGLPDDEYLMLGYLDIDELLASEIGRSILRNPLVGLAFNMIKLDPEKQLHELAFAVQFNADAYPNLYPAMPTILLVKADLTAEQLKALLRGGEAHPSVVDGVEVLSYSGKLPMFGGNIEGTAFVTTPEEGLTVVSTSKKLLQEYFAVRRGELPSLKAGGSMQNLVARADKGATGWLTMRHTDESRSLLKRMFEKFDDFLLSLEAGENLDLVCVANFPNEAGAREMVNSFLIAKKELENLRTEREEGKEKAAFGLAVDLYTRIEAEQSVDLAIFRAKIPPEEINRLIGASVQDFYRAGEQERQAEPPEEDK